MLFYEYLGEKTSNAFLLWIADEMFIEVPLFQETSPAR